MTREMHHIRRTILVKLMVRLGYFTMTYGYTFIERSAKGAVENSTFTPFKDLAACCAAAEAAANSTPGVERTQVVACQYDGTYCVPDLTRVFRSFSRAS